MSASTVNLLGVLNSSTSLTLTAVGGPVHYSISNPLSGNLSLSRSSGSLAAGQSVTIRVTVTSLLGLLSNVRLGISPGGSVVDVVVGLL